MKTGTSKMSRTAWGLDTLPDDEWRTRASCTPETAQLFEVFGRKGASVHRLSIANQQAVDICRRCPVKKECLADAVKVPNDFWFIAGGHLIHRGQVISTLPPRQLLRQPKPPAPEPDAPQRKAPTVARVADAVSDLYRLGWTTRRIAGALGVGEATVLRHSRMVTNARP